MSSKRNSTLQTSRKVSPSSLIKSWPSIIESIIDAMVGSRGSRYRARTDAINTSIVSLQVTLPTVLDSRTHESLSVHHAEDPRVKTLRSWVEVIRSLLTRIKKKISPAHKNAITSIDADLKRLHREVCPIRDIDIQLPSPSAPPCPSNRLSRNDESTTSGKEASPTIILLEKKKGLFRNPNLFNFELWDDRKDRFATTPALGRGPLFPKGPHRITKSSRYRRFSKNNLPQYKREKVKDDKVRVAGGSRLSFGEEVDTAKDKFNLLNPTTQVIIIQNQENYEKPLSSYGQPLQMQLPLARLAASSTLLRNLLLDKHSGAFEDGCDYVVYDPEKTLERKEYIHQIAIYAQGLLFNEEVQKRSENKYWDGLEETDLWNGLEVYARWVTTGFVVLEGREGVRARGKAAVQTAKFLGFHSDLEYWKALEDMATMVGAPILTW